MSPGNAMLPIGTDTSGPDGRGGQVRATGADPFQAARPDAGSGDQGSVVGVDGENRSISQCRAADPTAGDRTEPEEVIGYLEEDHATPRRGTDPMSTGYRLIASDGASLGEADTLPGVVRLVKGAPEGRYRIEEFFIDPATGNPQSWE